MSRTLVCAVLILFISLEPGRTQSPPQLSFALEDSYTLRPDVISAVRLCVFTGQPTPTVSWTVDGRDLPTEAEGGVYYIPEDGTLVIEQADSSDDGVYICTGTNAFGSVESNDIELTFVRQSVPWYISWYMWFIYAIILWAITIPFFVMWFFFQKKKAEHDLPPADGWIGN